MATKVDGLLFDKDGTLFDFSATWDAWTLGVIRDLSGGDPRIMEYMAEVMHFDLEGQTILPSSPIIACTNREVAETVAQALPGRSVDEIELYLSQSASMAPLTPAIPLEPYLKELAGQGLSLGVMTNDCEHAARAQLKSAGIESEFHFIAGFNSGFGAKPAPDPLLAFARAMDLAPDRVAMVGDSTHDLMAGRAAGMRTVGVLTGLAVLEELAPYADIVFPDIGHIPAWLTG